jgi:flagellin
LGGTAAGTETTALVAENARLAGKTTAIGAVVTDGNGGTVTALSAAVVATTGVTVGAIDTDIAAVTASRANYGADMVTFGSVVSGLQTASVNLSASFSRIMDTDYAAETASMTRNNILQQAGTAVLSQANQTPQSVLGLLR